MQKNIMSLVAQNSKKNIRKNLPSFLFSLFVHALLFFFFGMTFFRFHQSLTPPESVPQEALPEVTFDLTPPPQHREMVNTEAEHPLEKTPEHAAFESYENTAAATELPPSGTEAAPTLAGEKQDILSVKETDTTPEESSSVATSSLSSTSASSLITPGKEPLSVPEEKSSSSTAAPTAPVMGTLSSAAKNDLNSTRTSVVHGNISNKGKSSVAAEATPLGRYKKTLSDAISSRWRYYIDDRMELLSFGTATIAFYVTQQGKIESLHLLSNSSNQTFADCCIKSIMEAKLPPIPPDVAATLQDKKLEVEYRFTICTDTTF